MSYVVRCSLYNSNGPLLSAIKTNDLIIEDNVFYNGVKTLVTMINGINNRFKNNALVSVKLRPTDDDYFVWAALGNFIS